ncbi:MAG: GFA family protein [Sulfitobacter sp.]
MTSTAQPLAVATCHCGDCRRVSGAPCNTFAAFLPANVVFSPALGTGVRHHAEVQRWFCHACGTPLAAAYAYLPDQLYVPVGLFDQVDALVPQSESHTASRVCWVSPRHDLPSSAGSGRDRLEQADDR